MCIRNERRRAGGASASGAHVLVRVLESPRSSARKASEKRRREKVAYAGERSSLNKNRIKQIHFIVGAFGASSVEHCLACTRSPPLFPSVPCPASVRSPIFHAVASPRKLQPSRKSVSANECIVTNSEYNSSFALSFRRSPLMLGIRWKAAEESGSKETCKFVHL